VIYQITNEPQQARPATPSRPKNYFTLGKVILYFPTEKVIKSRRVNVVYDDEELLVGFRANKNGRCCITKSKGRAHVGIAKSNGLDKLSKRMPKGMYVPVKWNNVPKLFRAQLNKRDRIFRHESSLPTGGSTQTSTKKFKKKRVSKSTRRKISNSLKAHHRGRKSALKK
jgi:hypothetical protein